MVLRTAWLCLWGSQEELLGRTDQILEHSFSGMFRALVGSRSPAPTAAHACPSLWGTLTSEGSSDP
jgi:hypothetical protein